MHDSADGSDRTELGHVSLSWALDDEDDPTELTVFDPRLESTTHWITVDAASACDLAESV